MEREIHMIKCLCVGLGGAVGAMLRYLIGLVPVGASNGFPVKTLLINILGAFVIGVLAVLGEKHSLPPLLVLTLKTGVCGGFTTFSTFALETSQLFQNGSYGLGDRVCVCQCYFEHCGGVACVPVAVLSRADAMQRKGRA